MPLLYPMLPIMVVELAMYGAVSGLLFEKFKVPLFLALPLTMALGRVGYGLMFGILFAFNNEPVFKALTVWAALTTGLPGIVIQLTVIPLIINALDPKLRGKLKAMRNARIIKDAKRKIREGKATLIVIKRGAVTYEDTRNGVIGIISLLEKNEAALSGAVVTDKIVGKAAAAIFVLGGAASVYGATMSLSAKDFLESRGIAAEYGEIVDVIKNRDNTGICPIEQSIYNISDPIEAFEAIKKRLAEFSK